MPDELELSGGFGDEDDFGDTTAGLAETNTSLAPLSTRIAKAAWDPVPIPAPEIDPGLTGLTWPERSAEVTCHFVLSTERWLSPRGGLREWVRLNIKVAVALAATALLVVPAVSALLSGVADWTSHVADAVSNAAGAAGKLPPFVLGIVALVVLIKWLRSRHLLGAGRRRHHREDYDGYG